MTSLRFQTLRIAVLLMGWIHPWSCSAFYGVIEISDQRTLAGEIHLEEDRLVLTTREGESHSVTLDKLLSLRATTPPPPPPPPPTTPSHGVRGTYFPTIDFQGEGRQRVDPQVDFDWKSEPAMDGLSPDHFSVRWEGTLEAPTNGIYTFHTETDDGVRLWVNREWVIDQWKDQSVTEATGGMTLASGQKYDLKLEYYEKTGEAVARLSWTPPGQSRVVIPTEFLFPAPLDQVPVAAAPIEPAGPHGLLGVYFRSPNLTGPYEVATNRTIDIDWRQAPGRKGSGQEPFSVRWLGQLQTLTTEEYTLYLDGDVNFSLWVAGTLLLEGKKSGNASAASAPIVLKKNHPYDIRLQISDDDGRAKLRLSWSTPTIAKEIVPETALIPMAPPSETSLTGKKPAGLLMAGGSFIARRVESLDGTSVRFRGGRSQPSLSVVQVARIYLHNIPEELEESLATERPGLLLQNGDFVDGEVRELRNGKIVVSSILFGRKTFGLDKALAIVLHDSVPVPAAFQIQNTEDSIFLTNQPILHKGLIKFGDSSLAGFEVLEKDLVMIQRASP